MEASVAARPFVGVGRHLSHSQVSLFDRCQLAWYLKYVRGIQKPPTVPMLIGQCYHRALAHNFTQKLITGDDLPPEEVVNFYNDAADEALSSGSVHNLYAQDAEAVKQQGDNLCDLCYAVSLPSCRLYTCSRIFGCKMLRSLRPLSPYQ